MTWTSNRTCVRLDVSGAHSSPRPPLGGRARPGAARGSASPGLRPPTSARKVAAMSVITAVVRTERPRVAPSIMTLLESARHGLAAAGAEPAPATRYVAAHLAALRAAAAVVSARVEPNGGPRRRGPRSVWELLPRVAPALAEWAAFFAAGAAKRAAAEAGLPRAVSAREADDLLRDSETFLGLVEEALGVLAA